MYQKEKEEVIISAAYDMADKIYYMNNKIMRNSGVDVDDFRQDATMYILNLYRTGYMYIDDYHNPRGMVFTLLKMFYRNTLTTARRNFKNKNVSLNVEVDTEGTEYLETISEKTLMDPEQWSIKSLEVQRGESLLSNIVNSFDKRPFETFKYRYFDTENKKISAYELAKMISKGYTMENILKEYGVYTKNIGKNSKSAYVYKKTRQVANKFRELVSKLDENDREAIAYYVVDL